ncbi:MAG TPA: Sec-independent protein translocase protein TatB, partial [Aggregicoccus sp.]|nr:Sec-independent protein translocase protein TatB [Aggregicoccus sp.]
MFNVGAGEIVLILVVALIILGPQRLPELARGLGKFMREFRRQTDEVRGTLEREFYRMDQEIAREEPPPRMGATPPPPAAPESPPAFPLPSLPPPPLEPLPPDAAAASEPAALAPSALDPSVARTQSLEPLTPAEA